jgi:hypothetical protein
MEDAVASVEGKADKAYVEVLKQSSKWGNSLIPKFYWRYLALSLLVF